MSAAPEFLALQSVVAGRFSLAHEIGRGGMGIVFLAHDVVLERPVAIKLLAPSVAARIGMRRRFLREARIAAQCFHPHIVPIHSVEEAGDLAFFVMAYVRGETLAERLARTGPLPASEVRRIGREVGWALGYAHDRGVVHRDVKPENILLEDGSSRALIADFGIALHDDPTRTPASGEIAGTARFMAPEQALGEPVDGRADLYALGVTLHLAATGRYPFEAASSVALLARQSLGDAPSVRVVNPALPASLADAIDRCLARRADERFPSAAAFVAALEPGVLEVPVSPSLMRIRNSSDSALTGWAWAQVFQFTTRILMFGETSAIGVGMVNTLGVGVAIVTFVAAALRGIEALTLARRALRAGQPASEVADALAGAPSASEPTAAPTWGSRAQGFAVTALGIGLAYSQGSLSSVRYGDALSDFVQVALLVLPPFLIGRGIATTLRRSSLTGWLQHRVRVPLARRLTRMLGGVMTTGPGRRALAPFGHTEIMLEQAAEAIFARLPASLRESLRAVPTAAAALAREADQLREQDGQLAAKERAVRAESGVDRDGELRTIAAARAAVRARLSTAIAALETIRMDLLRLDTGTAITGLTVQLDVVRDLQRRVDAEAEVRDVLYRADAELTPV